MRPYKYPTRTERLNMKAQVLKYYDDHLTAPSWVDLENVADPKIEKASDVIVRIGGAGVCRTDLHIIEGVWREATDPDRKLLPLIMGHENAGWIEDVGSEVEGLKKGGSHLALDDVRDSIAEMAYYRDHFLNTDP